MNKEKQLDLYRKTINRIDDYLEYTYRKSTVEEIRNRILSEIDTLTNELTKL